MSRAGPPSGGPGASRAEAKGGSSVGPPSGGPGAAGGGRLPGGRRAARVPPAPAPGRGRRRGKDPALADRAPEPLDLRLAPTALTAWGVAAWAVARPAGSWRSLSVLAALAGLLALVLLRPVLRFRAARHRDDPRPGSQSPDVPAHLVAGSLAASLLLPLLAGGAVLGTTAAHQWSRCHDPLSTALARGTPVTLVGTVSRQPRVAGARGETVLTTLEVGSVDGRVSTMSVTLLGRDALLDVPMGSRLRLHATLRALPAGQREGALVRATTFRVLAPPSGVLGLVTGLRAGLARAAGQEPGGSGDVRDRGRAAQGGDEPWPSGTRALVPGLALGDDHALPTDLREAMRDVSMTHLTAVSGEHVAMVLGLVLTALGVLPRRWRAGAGALVLTALVVLVRPGGSVLRAAVMGAVLLVGVAAGRRSSALPALGVSVVLLVLVDPFQSRDYGFALSVAATGGILLGARGAQAALGRYLPRWLAALVALPLVAQAACAPVLVMLRPAVGVWAVPANVVAAPPVPVATVSGLLATLVAPWWPWGARVLAWPALAACAWLALVSRCLASLPGAVVPWPQGVAGALGLAVLEVVILVACSRRVRGGCRRGAVLLTWAGLVLLEHVRAARRAPGRHEVARPHRAQGRSPPGP